MRVEDLGRDELEALLPVVEDLRHDLGKYVCFEVRFVGLDAGVDDLRAALRADLLATRRRAGQTEAAWQLWGRLRPDALDGDDDVAVIDQAVAQLRRAELERRLDGDRDALIALAGQATVVRDATRRISDRIRRAAEAAGLDPDDP